MVIRTQIPKAKNQGGIAEHTCGIKTLKQIMFSTDLSKEATDIFLIYHSRFQIEFIFHDAKQNTGLEDWQYTDADRLTFGYNASLSAVHVARGVTAKIQEATGRKLSAASVKKVLHNGALYQ